MKNIFIFCFVAYLALILVSCSIKDLVAPEDPHQFLNYYNEDQLIQSMAEFDRATNGKYALVPWVKDSSVYANHFVFDLFFAPDTNRPSILHPPHIFGERSAVSFILQPWEVNKVSQDMLRFAILGFGIGQDAVPLERDRFEMKIRPLVEELCYEVFNVQREDPVWGDQFGVIDPQDGVTTVMDVLFQIYKEAILYPGVFLSFHSINLFYEDTKILEIYAGLGGADVFLVEIRTKFDYDNPPGHFGKAIGDDLDSIRLWAIDIMVTRLGGTPFTEVQRREILQQKVVMEEINVVIKNAAWSKKRHF
jgi:hypothetical protein